MTSRPTWTQHLSFPPAFTDDLIGQFARVASEGMSSNLHEAQILSDMTEWTRNHLSIELGADVVTRLSRDTLEAYYAHMRRGTGRYNLPEEAVAVVCAPETDGAPHFEVNLVDTGADVIEPPTPPVQPSFFTEITNVLDVTDHNLSVRFLSSNGSEVRYCPAFSDRDPWMHYHEGVWHAQRKHKVEHEIGLTLGQASRDCEHFLKTLDPGDRQSRIAYAQTKEKLDKLRAGNKAHQVLTAMRKDLRVHAEIADFDKDPLLFNIANGTLNLSDFTCRPHSPFDYLMKKSPVAFDKDARCPQFMRFLERVLPDPGVRDFVQRWFGYCLTGDTRIQWMVICHGGGQNGKSTLIDIILHVMGDYGMKVDMSAFEEATSDRTMQTKAAMMGKRCILATETSQEVVTLREGFIKDLTGGEPVAARFLYASPFNYSPTYKVTLSLNLTPNVSDTSISMRRRLRIVPFTVTIPDEEKIDNLAKLLIEHEAPGILNWLVEGCRLFLTEGIFVPPAIRSATERYFEEMDILGQFIEEVCVVDPSPPYDLTSGYAVLGVDFGTEYNTWRKMRGFKETTQNMIGRKLATRGFYRYKSDGRVFWYGISLKRDASFTQLHPGQTEFPSREG